MHISQSLGKDETTTKLDSNTTCEQLVQTRLKKLIALGTPVVGHPYHQPRVGPFYYGPTISQYAAIYGLHSRGISNSSSYLALTSLISIVISKRTFNCSTIAEVSMEYQRNYEDWPFSDSITVLTKNMSLFRNSPWQDRMDLVRKSCKQVWLFHLQLSTDLEIYFLNINMTMLWSPWMRDVQLFPALTI